MTRNDATPTEDINTAQAEDITAFRDSFRRRLDARNKNRRTIDLYTSAVDELTKYLRANGMPLTVRGIRLEHLESFFIDLRDRPRPWAPSTRNQCYRSLQQFWKFCVTEDEIQESPMRKLDAPPIPETPHGGITPDQYDTLMRAIRGNTFRDVRDRALLAFLYDTGARRAEVTAMKLEDLDLTMKTAHVIGKGDRTGPRPRDIPFGRTTAVHLDRYLRDRARWTNDPDRRVAYADYPWLWLSENRRGEGHITPSGLNQIIRARGQAAGLPDIHPHLFRHGWADAVARSGLQTPDIMNIAGWKSVSMLLRYASGTAGERARAAYAPHSPVDKLRER